MAKEKYSNQVCELLAKQLAEEQQQLERVRNTRGTWINKGCMSCQHKKYLDGIRFCKLTDEVVEARSICPQWELSDGLKNAGLVNGGVVRQRGTKEVIF